jgi:hypothetical protein
MSLQKEKPVISKPYRMWISLKPCLACPPKRPHEYFPQSDPHHWQKKGHGTMGGKCSDLRCTPLCHPHHVEYDLIGRDSFMAKYGLTEDGIENIIKAFNDEWEKT